jgi:2-methylisocitrate lyase-like PEP mutase family enzyme
MRTVREYEQAGAAAIHIEDQVWPKRCGFLEGKEVIPLREMAAKVRAACDARQNPDFVIIGRTDALAPKGWDEAEDRARAYREAGADLVFVDGIRSLDDLDTYAKRLGDLPLLYNGQLLPVPEIATRGFKLMIHTATLAAVYRAIRDAMAELKADGQVQSANDAGLFAELLSLLGVPEVLETSKKYQP